MKKNKMWLFLSLFAVAVACKDDDAPSNSITSDEAAAIVSSSLASNTSGVNLVSGASANATEDMLEDNDGGRVAVCGLSQNVDFSGENPDGATVTYSYDFSYKFKLNCEAEAPAVVTVDLSYSGEFDAPKLAAGHSGIAELDLTGLEESEPAFFLNGLFKRSGSFENKELAKIITCSVDITLDELVINKATHQITAGTGTYEISGSVPDKGAFKYVGTITFKGADGAEINVNGSVYNANLKNAEVAKK